MLNSPIALLSPPVVEDVEDAQDKGCLAFKNNNG